MKAKTGQYNYAIEIGDNVKVFHINMLKQYHRRAESVVASVATITFEDDDSIMELETPDVSGVRKPETHKDVNINPELTEEQQGQLRDLVEAYSEIFSSAPGTTNLIEHKIVLTDKEPIWSNPYPVPYAMYDDMKKEIDDMLN